jgi:NTP pyrophosphatase (non-canonical NTP hydrolase)
MKNLPEGMMADHDNGVYYDTEKGEFYIIKWDKGYYDTPNRHYIQTLNKPSQTQTQTAPEIRTADILASGVRPSVFKFAYAMEEILKENDRKGGWEECSHWYLFEQLEGELGELREILEAGKTKNKLEQIRKECTDIANYAHMIYDIAETI